MGNLLQSIGNSAFITWMMDNPVITWLNDTGIFMLLLMWFVTPYAIYKVTTCYWPKELRDEFEKDIRNFLIEFAEIPNEVENWDNLYIELVIEHGTIKFNKGVKA